MTGWHYAYVAAAALTLVFIGRGNAEQAAEEGRTVGVPAMLLDALAAVIWPVTWVYLIGLGWGVLRHQRHTDRELARVAREASRRGETL